jgi:hypothetical protein
MLLFGHRFIKSEKFYHIIDVDAIEKTPPSSTLYIKFNEENLDIIEYAYANSIAFALSVADVTELIYASALGARYIVVSNELAKSAQEIAENYLFDAKILTKIKDEDAIQEMAELGIDGVLFSNAIIKINS